MQYKLTSEGERRLADFVQGVGGVLANKKRRESFACYAMGLLGDGDRKSTEPIAARACPDPEEVDALHQRLLHFIGKADWSDVDVRQYATRYALTAHVKHLSVGNLGRIKAGVRCLTSWRSNTWRSVVAAGQSTT